MSEPIHLKITTYLPIYLPHSHIQHNARRCPYNRSAMLFFVVAATVMVTTFLMLTAWKKLKRRRRLRFREAIQ